MVRAVVFLHGLGFTIVRSMRLLVNEYGLTLAEAKRIVDSPVWSEVVAAAIPLQEDVVRFLGGEKGKL